MSGPPGGTEDPVDHEPGRALVPVPKAPAPAPGVVDLVARGARVGVDAAGLLATEVLDASVKAARAVLPPVVAERPLGAVGDALERRRDSARRRETESREAAAVALQAVVGQVVEVVLDQIDMEALIDRIPVEHVIDRIDVDEIAARIDIDAIIDRVDVAALVRDSTTGLAGETVDAIRVQVMGLDLFAARVVDWVLRRKHPRDLELAGYDVTGPEIRVPRELR